MGVPKAVLFALAGTAGWLMQAGGLEAWVSNQSRSESIYDAGLNPRIDRVQVEPALLVFCGSHEIWN